MPKRKPMRRPRRPNFSEIPGQTSPGDFGRSLFAKAASEPTGLAADLVYNGDFYDSANWTTTAGWTIASGKATHTTGTGALTQSQAPYGIPALDRLVAGQSYVWAIIVSGRTAGSITPRFTGGTTVTGSAITSNGLAKQTLVAAAGNNTIGFLPSNDFNGSITAVGLRKVAALPATAKLQITLADMVTTQWYQRKPDRITPQMCGCPIETDNPANAATTTQAIKDAALWAQFSGLPLYIPGLGRDYLVNAKDSNDRGLIFTLGQGGIGDNAAFPRSFEVYGDGLSTVLKNVAADWDGFVYVDEGADIVIRDLVFDGNYPEFGGGLGHGIAFANNGMVRRARVSNVVVRNTFGYGIALQNNDLLDGIFENITVERAGNDGVDIKARNAPPPDGRIHRKQPIRLNNIYVNGFNTQGSDDNRAGIDIRGYVLANNLYVEGFPENVNGGSDGVQLDAAADDELGPRLGARKSQVTNVFVSCETSQSSSTRNSGLVIWDAFTNVTNAVIEGCGVGLLVEKTGDSIPEGIGLKNITVIGARQTDLQGVSIELNGASGGDIAIDAIVENCDIGFSAGANGFLAGVRGDITLRGCAKGHDLTLAQLQTADRLDFSYTGNTNNNDLGFADRTVAGDLRVVAAADPTIRLAENGDTTDFLRIADTANSRAVISKVNAGGSATLRSWRRRPERVEQHHPDVQRNAQRRWSGQARYL